MNNLVQIEPQYVYVTIPAEYICIYHRILAMLADYGLEVIQDCKAKCSDKNNCIIECFNMFNSAVACYKLEKKKEANLIIKYIKAKLNQIYKGEDNSTSFVFPVDKNGKLKAIVSCGERPIFRVNIHTGELLEHKLNNGFTEHFALGKEDEPIPDIVEYDSLDIKFEPRFETINNITTACCDLIIKYNGNIINPLNCDISYYYDDIEVQRFNNIINPAKGNHKFEIVVIYGNTTKIVTKYIDY